MYAMLAFMLGFLYYDVGSHFTHSDIISRASLLMYTVCFFTFMSIAALPFFMIERDLVIKEVKNNLYSSFMY